MCTVTFQSNVRAGRKSRLSSHSYPLAPWLSSFSLNICSDSLHQVTGGALGSSHPLILNGGLPPRTQRLYPSPQHMLQALLPHVSSGQGVKGSPLLLSPIFFKLNAPNAHCCPLTESPSSDHFLLRQIHVTTWCP